ncbi:MAG: exo-alpha-sialidase [Phycisphaeraceae bacterium]|nr:exo-alpha-sialidase [Phycisphaeraceae bacterium]
MTTLNSNSSLAAHIVERSPRLVVRPGGEYGPAARTWQGIPGIERTTRGRLWATWYTGQGGEGAGNHVVVGVSDDDGKTWIDPFMVIAPASTAEREFDSCLWSDPNGTLWLFWSQCNEKKHFDGRAGVWETHTANPDAEKPTWSAPRRIANGIMMNKPTVLSSGRWLLPTSVWSGVGREWHRELDPERFSNVLASDDQGRTFQIIGSADVPDRTCDEHMIVERRDGQLWMLVRTRYGIGESFSADGGRTWSLGQPSRIEGPGSRIFIRRLRSGRLLLINHDRKRAVDSGLRGRSFLTAWLSDDEGMTWDGGLLLDERLMVSYPDGIEADDGRIFVIYDFNRGDIHSPTAERQVLMAVFREQDVDAGRLVSADARLRVPASQATGLLHACYVPLPG